MASVDFIQSKDQKVLENSEDGSVEITSNKLSDTEVEYTLEIKSVNSDTCTFYEIKAKNTSGEASSKFNLVIFRKPEFARQLSEVTNLIENGELLLDCTVLANPDATITWLKDNIKLANSKRMQISELKDDKTKPTQGQKTYSLKIPIANKEDAGVYEIHAVNKLGEARSRSQVLVEYAPLIVKDLRIKEKATEGNTFAFECNIKANPKPDIKWLFFIT